MEPLVAGGRTRELTHRRDDVHKARSRRVELERCPRVVSLLVFLVSFVLLVYLIPIGSYPSHGAVSVMIMFMSVDIGPGASDRWEHVPSDIDEAGSLVPPLILEAIVNCDQGCGQRLHLPNLALVAITGARSA